MWRRKTVITSCIFFFKTRDLDLKIMNLPQVFSASLTFSPAHLMPSQEMKNMLMFALYPVRFFKDLTP